MTTRMNGFRKRTRQKFTKEHSDKGKVSIRKFLQKFEVGDKVHLHVEPAYQKGMYRPKYMGKTGVISAKRGTCYLVQISDFRKTKQLLVHPVHLTRA